jgi:hypothetical protein
MRTILHLLTRPDDPLAQETIARQAALPDTQCEVADLAHGEPDYAALVGKIFAADSVQVW